MLMYIDDRRYHTPYLSICNLLTPYNGCAPTVYEECVLVARFSYDDWFYVR